MDPYIVLSLANMKLRNFYSDLDMLCDDVGVERRALEDKLQMIGYHYERKGNHFVANTEKTVPSEK